MNNVCKKEFYVNDSKLNKIYGLWFVCKKFIKNKEFDKLKLTMI